MTSKTTETTTDLECLGFEGRPFVLGGKTYVVPPLSYYELKQLGELLAKLQSGISNDEEARDIQFTFIFHALRRNYRGVTKDLALQLVDLGNSLKLFRAAMGMPEPDVTSNGATPPSPLIAAPAAAPAVPATDAPKSN